MISFSRLSLKRKLVWLILAAMILTLLCFTLAAVSFEITTFRPRMVQRSQSEAGILEELLSGPLDFQLQDAAENVLQKYCQDRPVALVALYDKKTLFAVYRRPGSSLPIPPEPQIAEPRFTAYLYSYWWPVHNTEQALIGHLYMAVELPPLHDRLTEYGILAGAVLLTLTIFGFILMTGLRRNILDPISTLLQTTRHISHSNDYSIRAEVKREDELGQLAGAFNQMLETIGYREADLREKEEHFRSLIENASDMITVINEKGVVRYISPSVERIAGYLPDMVIGHSISEFIHPEDMHHVRETMEQNDTISSPMAKIQYRFLHMDKSWRVFDSIGRSIPNKTPDGYIILNSRDVSDSLRLEEQLRQALKMEALGRLSGGIAHDFNNLLTVILGHVSLMETDGALSKNMRESLIEIGKSANRAANLTRQLLAFGRRQTLQWKHLNLNEVVSDMTRMLNRILGEDIHLCLRYASQPAAIHGDVGMIEQILLNLAVNARDAMPQGGQLMIETQLLEFDETMAKQMSQSKPGPAVCLSVSDTGCGIPSEILPHIFEPFFTTKDVGKGTGLGLATVYGIVQQHSGWCHVYSELGHGTTFHIYFPQLIHANWTEPVSSLSGNIRGGTETILLVEDEPALRILTRNILEQLGYRVLDAPNGISALEVWHKNKDTIQLLLTDMVMPEGMSGLNLAEQLHRERSDLKIIYTSGYSAEITGQDFLEEGVNFLAKPFNLHQLAQAVRHGLDRS